MSENAETENAEPRNAEPKAAEAQSAVPDFAAFGQHLSGVIQAAHEAAGRMRDEAKAQAEADLAAAQADIAQLRADAATELEQLRTDAEDDVERMRAVSDREAAAARDHAAASQARADELVTTAKRKAEELLGNAMTSADEIAAASARKLATITAQRNEIFTQLGKLRDQLHVHIAENDTATESTTVPLSERGPDSARAARDKAKPPADRTANGSTTPASLAG